MELDQTKNDASNLKQSTVTGTSTALQFKMSHSAAEKVHSVVVESLQPLKQDSFTEIKCVSVGFSGNGRTLNFCILVFHT